MKDLPEVFGFIGLIKFKQTTTTTTIQTKGRDDLKI